MPELPPLVIGCWLPASPVEYAKPQNMPRGSMRAGDGAQPLVCHLRKLSLMKGERLGTGTCSEFGAGPGAGLSPASCGKMALSEG